MNFLAAVIFAIAVQGFFLCYLLINTNKGVAQRVLAALVLAMSIAILGPAMGLAGYYVLLPHFIRVGDPLVFVFGPLLFIYICCLTRGQLPKKWLLHFLPFLLYVLYLLPFYAMSGDDKIAYVERLFADKTMNTETMVVQFVRTVHVTIYMLASLQLVVAFQKQIKDNFSNIEKVTLATVSRLLKLFLAVAVVGTCTFIASFFTSINIVFINGLISLTVGIVIYGVAYATWSRPAVVLPEQVETMTDTPLPPELPAKPAEPEEIQEVLQEEKERTKHHIRDEDYPQLVTKLEELVKEGLHLDNDLTLLQLAYRLHIQPYQASELINRYYKGSFFDFINSKRIQEVQKRLKDPELAHFSVLGIAMDCGFNSKSSFNTAFKKFTGLTPTQFRETTPA
ncbi:helix-turn-helix domain-containing protein [Aridibaculum aurantiacum]|uniref:helix-turn-helix domain-containing protein n=1 Tax=Aridibaculum aurantiacum TaxID=2810307 RepID=UPI001A96F721|nr:AraC family transcriptional regulator [Aridibaculum aurantiacum]